MSLLASSPFTGFRWETPPVTATTAADRPFEFVLLDAPRLASKPDTDAFSDQWSAARDGASVLAFPNLGGDATLVVPCPRDGVPPTTYAHLAAFIRNAPPDQVHQLWRVVGATMLAQLGPRPIWLSTAGMGVAWLHVRLDQRPKYYGHSPYRSEA